ncbi:hypothetical protein OSB04_003255 [Centaurea solstitialis]|uniref:Aspartyl protease n=1 Tax=Centaurea solstitialis TaxID=347529 RepID=A0AA38WV58_9ASTR|nr:hypothetical protein OSB04_003255 [Centaurea solstitialis]
MDCLKINDEDICLVDSGSTHTVLKKKIYFSYLTTQKANISTTSGVISVRMDNKLRLRVNDVLNTFTL